MSALPDVIALQDFAAVDWQAPLAGCQKVDCQDLAHLFAAAANVAEEAEDSCAARVFRLLHQVCSIVLDTGDPASALRARLVLAEGRSAEPADFRGAQSEVFAALLGTAVNPALRARLGDIVWTNNRKAKDAALVASDAYAETVEGLLAERYDEAVPGFGRSTFEQVTLVTRALQIGRAVLKGGALPDRAVAAALAVYARAVSCREHVAFTHIAGAAARFGLMEAIDIAGDAEAVADGPYPPGHTFAVQGVWDFAAHAYAGAKDADGERRCRLRAVDMTLDRARSDQSAMVAAHWLQVAMEALRRIRDTKDQRDALMLELREKQREARDEFKPARPFIDVQELAEATLASFDHQDPSTCLHAFARLHAAADPKVIRDHARDSLRKAFFGALFGGSHADIDGKTIARTPGFDPGGEPPDARIDEQIDQIMGNYRRQVVGGMIDPARDAMMHRFAFADRHFWPVVMLSAYVPPGQARIFSLGFARFLQGDMVSAAHLLLPQLEPMLRHILTTQGREPSTIKADMLQEDQSLGPLLSSFRDELEATLGPELVFEIDVLFNKRPGPRLRHELAHGKITASGCFSPEVIYACWLIFRILAEPFLEHWDETIGAALDRIEANPGALRRKN